MSDLEDIAKEVRNDSGFRYFMPMLEEVYEEINSEAPGYAWQWLMTRHNMFMEACMFLVDNPDMSEDDYAELAGKMVAHIQKLADVIDNGGSVNLAKIVSDEVSVN